jgi:hypothetical protein
MKIKPNLESTIYLAVIVLCLITLLLVVSSGDLFRDTKVVYQAF